MRLASNRAAPNGWPGRAAGASLAVLVGLAVLLLSRHTVDGTAAPETIDVEVIAQPAPPPALPEPAPADTMPPDPVTTPPEPPDAAAPPDLAPSAPPDAAVASLQPVASGPAPVPESPVPSQVEPAVRRSVPTPPLPRHAAPRRPAVSPHASATAGPLPIETAQTASEARSTPAPAAAAAPSASELSAFSASMRRAVQEALIYPPAARMAGEKGEVKVAFDFLDGTASNVVLSGSSGLPLLDQAALATVRIARYGASPATLAHRTLHLTVAVRFDPDRPG